MPDLYSPPSFQFYPGDFIEDTMDLTAQEIGAYLLLLCRAWKDGGIPADSVKRARIARLSAKEMESVWETVERFWKPDEQNQDVLLNGKMERIRESSRQISLKRAENGKRGGKRRQPDTEQPDSKSEANAKQMLSKTEANVEQNGSPRGGSEEAKQSSADCCLLTANKSTDVDGASAEDAPARKRREPSVEDMASYRILDAAWPVISEQHQLAIDRKSWREHNKRAALAMARNGTTPEEVIERLGTAYGDPAVSKYYGGITTLAKLIEHWSALGRIATEEPDPDVIRRRVLNGDFLPE